MSPVRCAVLGSGFAGSTFAESLQYAPDAQLVAIAGGRKAPELAQHFGVRALATSEIDALLDADEIDAVLDRFAQSGALSAGATSTSVGQARARRKADGDECRRVSTDARGGERTAERC